MLPPESKIRVSQSPGPVTAKALANFDHVVVCLARDFAGADWRRVPEGRRLERLSRKRGRDKLLHSQFGNSRGTGITLGRPPAGAGPDQPGHAFALLKFAGSLAADALAQRPASIAVLVAGFDENAQERVQKALLLAIYAHAFDLPRFKSTDAKSQRLRKISLIGHPRRIDVSRVVAEAEAINLTRWLTRLPPNKLNARAYRDAIARLARHNDWKLQTYSTARLKKLGAGAFLAVCQGNADDDACIVRLQYRPADSGRRPAIALVGKGIIFDTGGTNLKPFKSMLDMHEDMAGSATALATLQALTAVGFDRGVDCWLAITENRIGNKAYKSRDIVTACNGTTIEVIHTDAEGRMVLADSLALAGRERPSLIIDYATLTGTCVHALTERYSGVFTNRAELNGALIEAGVASGERVWPFPMDADYDDDIESKVADVLQCSLEGSADQILAARFLQRFVPDISTWIHIDLSAASRKDGLGQVPAGPTGFGVRFSLNLLLDRGDVLSVNAGESADPA